MKRTNSQIMLALSKGRNQEDSETTETTESAQVTQPAEKRRGLPRVNSGLGIANIYTETKEGSI